MPRILPKNKKNVINVGRSVSPPIDPKPTIKPEELPDHVEPTDAYMEDLKFVMNFVMEGGPGVTKFMKDAMGLCYFLEQCFISRRILTKCDNMVHKRYQETFLLFDASAVSTKILNHMTTLYISYCKRLDDLRAEM